MIDEIIRWFIAYTEIGIEFIASHLLTVEGVIALIFGMFFLGLLSEIRS